MAKVDTHNMPSGGYYNKVNISNILHEPMITQGFQATS